MLPYKETELVWMGKVPSHWEILKVKSKFNIVKFPNQEESPTILSLTMNGMKVRDISKNEGQLAQSYIGYNTIEIGDICLNPMDLESGAAAISKCKGVISNAYFTIRPKDSSEINSKFYAEYFNMHYRKRIFYPFGKGVGRPEGSGGRWTLNRDTFFNFPILYLPKPEQDQIVRYLDSKLAKINKFIRDKKKIIELLKEQKQAIINKAVTKGLAPNVKMKPSGIDWIGDIPDGWEIKKLSLISKIILSGLDKKNYSGQEPVNICNYVDVYKNDYISNNIDFLKATATQNEIENFLLYKDDIIITKDSEAWDDIAIPTFVCQKLAGVLCGYHLAIIRVNSLNVDSEFVYNTFLAEYVSNQFKIKAKGVTRYGISYQHIHDTIIILPSLTEQKAIVSYLTTKRETIHRTIERIQREIDLISEYRTSLISSVVTGKVDVRNIKVNDITENLETDFDDLEEELIEDEEIEDIEED